MHPLDKKLIQERERIQKGGAPRYHEKLREQNKMFIRDKLRMLFDEDSIVEDGLFANCLISDLPGDAAVAGIGRINGRPVAFMGADATVKAGSWGEKSVERILRVQELAMKMRIPMIYMVDSAGGRITDQLNMFPGRRHGGRIFYNQVKMSGTVPQICILFGPSPAGAAYVPAFSDLVVMVDKNASAYLGSVRMVEMVIGEKTTMEEMGGARMHCSRSGLGDILAKDETEAIEIVKRYLQYLPQNYEEAPPVISARQPKDGPPISEIVPTDPNRPFDMKRLIERIVDQNSWFEIKPLFAQEIVVGFGRLEGRVVGIVANQPVVKGGTLFSDSADKAARFIWLCNAYNIPLLFLADVPGFMVGSAVERGGIIRHGAKMISAVSEATVPKISVIVRKCYGAGLYAMCGPAFDTEVVIALPTAQIAVMGPEAAINAVYYNKIQELLDDQRAEFVAQKRREYAEDIDIYRLASELIVDDIISFDELRGEVVRRFALYGNKRVSFGEKKNPIHPV